MNATSRAGASRTSSGETTSPSRSGSRNAGSGVPSDNIVDGVADNLEERERQFDRHEHSDGLSEARAGTEPPLLGGLDRFLVETEGGVERAHDLDAANAAIRQDDTFEEHRALDLGPHRVGGVLRLHFLRGLRQLHTVARPVRAAAGAATESGTKSRTLTRSCSGT